LACPTGHVQNYDKRAAVTVQVCTDPWVSRRLRLPGFLDYGHMKVVRLLRLGSGRLSPQENFLVLISVGGLVYPRTISNNVINK
jgi:hypothetical protein